MTMSGLPDLARAPFRHLAGHPVTVIQGQVMPGRRVGRQRTVPSTGDFRRAPGIHQPVSASGQYQGWRRSRLGRAEPRSRDQLPPGVAGTDGPRYSDGGPVPDELVRGGCEAGGELEDAALPGLRGRKR